MFPGCAMMSSGPGLSTGSPVPLGTLSGSEHRVLNGGLPRFKGRGLVGQPTVPPNVQPPLCCSSQGGCKDAGKWGGLRTWSENGRDCISTQVRFTCEPSASDSPTNRPPYRSSKAFAETWVRHYIKTRESSPFGPRSLTCDTTQPLLQGQSLSQRQEGGTGLLSGGTQADLDLRGRRRVSQQ